MNESIAVRRATLRDVNTIAELNRLAYPDLAEDGLVWRPDQLRSHLAVFPDGQLVAEESGRIVGAASSLIVSLGRDPYRDHTWAGITDNGMFYSHDPFGDTLYGADVNVHPDARRRGVGRRLYEARRKLCIKLNLRRIVLGGRLYDYSREVKSMAAAEYARRVQIG